MHHSVMQFGQFAGIPSVGGAHKISRDALDGLEGCLTFRTFLHGEVCIFIATFGAMITVVVHTSVAHVIFVEHVDNLHDGLLVVGGVSVHLHIENMAAPC